MSVVAPDGEKCVQLSNNIGHDAVAPLKKINLSIQVRSRSNSPSHDTHDSHQDISAELTADRAAAVVRKRRRT
jgi:hypothetical protein